MTTPLREARDAFETAAAGYAAFVGGLRGEGVRPADWDDLTYVLAGSGRIPGPNGYPLLG